MTKDFSGLVVKDNNKYEKSLGKFTFFDTEIMMARSQENWRHRENGYKKTSKKEKIQTIFTPGQKLRNV
jgi:hypothetical protein